MDNELGTSASLLSLPASGAGIRGLGENFQTDLYTGTGSYSIPLDLPAAQNGFKPDLGLRYSTGSGNGLLGQGWELTLSSIQRSSNRGFPTFDDQNDIFVLDDELVPVGGQRQYRPRVDTKGWRILKETDHWTMTTKDGVIHKFGQTASARIEHPAGMGTLCWLIDEITTPSGQSAQFHYRGVGVSNVIESIVYGPFRIVFEYELRPDATISYRAGFPIEQLLRCREIRIESDRSPTGELRRYRFEYAKENAISLLARVVLEAGAGASLVEMPRINFAYGAWDASRIEVIDVTTDPAIPLPNMGDTEVDLVDLEGSGRPGVVFGVPNGWLYWPNQGKGHFGTAKVINHVPDVSVSHDLVRFLDVDGSGTADLLWGGPHSGFFPNSAGGDWEEFVSYRNDLPFNLSDPELRLYDIDGDGKIDALITASDALVAFKNAGRDGWIETPLRVPRIHDLESFPDVSFSSPNIFTADMTGDGLTDIVMIRNGSIQYWPCAGPAQWGHRIDMAGAPVFPPDFDPRHVRLIDVDGNGVADLIYLDSEQAQIWLNDRGQGWSEPVTIPILQLDRNHAVAVDLLGTGQAGIFWSRSDSVTGRLAHQFLSFGMVPEHRMLIEVHGDLGHKTKIVYGTSGRHRERDEQAGQPWTTFLPFSLPVVDRIENYDAPAGVVAVATYTYRNGHFDGIERSFNGFGEVHQETAGDESTPAMRVQTRFHPGADIGMTEAERRQLDPNIRLGQRALKGSPLEIERYEQKKSEYPRLLDQTVNRLSTRVDFEGPAGRVLVPFSVDSITDEGGDVESRRTIVRYSPPDSFLNPVWTEFEAGVLRTGSSYTRTNVRREVFDYVDANSLTGPWWLPGLMSQRLTLDATGQALSCVRFYYDGPDFEGLEFGLAQRGILRRIEELVAREGEFEHEEEIEQLGHHLLRGPSVKAPGWYRNRSRTRNADTGQVLVARDPSGNETQIEYDAWGIDPIRTIDAAQLTTVASYDHAVECLASVTNPSGVTERRVYDALGRTRQVMRTGSLGSLDIVAVVQHDYGDYHAGGVGRTPPSITTIVPWSGGRSPLEFETQPLASIQEATVGRRYYSSSGLELESVSSGSAQDSDLQLPVHSGERTFSTNGKVVGEGRPRFAAGFAMLGLSGAALPYQRSYDTAGREVSSIFPRGRREQRFEPFRTLIADANAVASDAQPNIERVFDGFGRLVETRERISGTVTAPHGFEYTAENWLAAIRGTGNDLLVEYSFDRLGRRTRARHRDAGEYQYVYDAAGNLVQTKHPTGALTNFGYDTIQRLIRIEHRRPDGSLEAVHRLSHDRSPDGTSICGGRLCAIEDDSGLTVLDYAPDGRLSAKRRTTPEGKQLVLRFEYNFRGLISAIIYPDQTRITYDYGPEGEITGINGLVNRIAYDERGRPVLILFANGIDTRLIYDETERPAIIETRRDGNLLGRFEQYYDRIGNPTRIISRVDGSPDEERNLEYDLLNRLTRSVGRRGDQAFDYRFEYDLSGNLLSNSEHGIDRFLYEDSQRPGLLTGLVRHGAAPERLRNYDSAGRLTSTESLAEIGYSVSDRLAHAVTRTGDRQSIVYDLYGHRAQSTVQSLGGVVNTRLVLDDLYEEVGEERVIHVKGIGGLVAIIRRNATEQSIEMVHYDLQGSVRFSTDRDGVVRSRFSYTSFGLDVASLRVDGAFTGKDGDLTLGFIQLGIRYYEPLTGRFTTPDLLLIERPNLALSDPSQFNLYVYALNNPFRYHDPRGRFVWLIVIAGVLIGGTIGYMTAKENGKNPWIGALIGGLVGGLVAAAGLLPEALIGAGISAGGAWLSGASSKEIWTGAALGFAFGAIGGAVSAWTPVVGGVSTGAKVANALIEVVSSGLTSGLAAGTSNAVLGRSFEDGFKSGFILGAALGAARVAIFGVRFDPSSVNSGFHEETAKAFQQQNQWDKYNALSGDVAKAGMPDPSTVQFRTGGLLNLLNGDRSFAFGNTVQTDGQTMDDLRNGSASTLAHELRHIAQQRELVLGSLEFLIIWLSQGSDQHYQPGPQNTTLEPYYGD